MFWIFQQLHLGPVIDPVISGHASSVACPGIHLDVNYLWRCLGCVNLKDVFLYWWFVRGDLTDSSLTGQEPLLESTELNEWSSTVKLSYGILKSSVRKFIYTLEQGSAYGHLFIHLCLTSKCSNFILLQQSFIPATTSEWPGYEYMELDKKIFNIQQRKKSDYSLLHFYLIYYLSYAVEVWR